MILLSADEMLKSILDILLGRMALFIYAIILCAVVILLAIAAMVSARKNAHPVAEKIELVAPLEGVDGEKKKIEAAPEESSRFSMLSEIDKKCGSFQKMEVDESLSLSYLCEGFRNYCSSVLHLYYSLEDIRRYVASLCTSRLLVLQGMSGTGKTSLPNAFGKYVENGAVIVPIQPMWKERTDLLGYYNEFTKKFNETQLLETLYEASY
jgi:hypothetical protein